MMRGSTPLLTFTVPYDSTQSVAGFITFAQDGEIILDRDISTWICDGQKVQLKLTQEETLKFNDRSLVEIQIRARMHDGEAIVSKVMRDAPGRILHEGVI